MKVVLISASLREGCNAPYEAGGVWEVTLDKDYPPGVAAGIATDVFCQSVRLHDLDDFELKALDPLDHSVVEESSDYIPCYTGAGDVVKIADDSLGH